MTPRTDFIARDYQRIAMRHMLDNPRCAVWAGMGMGKTVAVLTVVDVLRITGAIDGPVLVCAPLRVAQSTWPDEAAKWSHLKDIRVRPIVGTEVERLAALLDPDANVFTINYENLPWLAKALRKHWPFSLVVADESTRLKSFRGGFRKHPKTGRIYFQGSGKSVRAKALARIAHLNVDRFIELTGTPSPNGLKDLWGQTWFLDAGRRLGRSFEAFSRRWFQKSWDGHGLEPLPHTQDEIQTKLQDLCLSLEAKDYFDIKKPIETIVRVALPRKVQPIYDEMQKEMFTELDDGTEIEVFNAASKTNKCQQIANGHIYVEPGKPEYKVLHDAKLDALESIIEEASGMPVLVAYHFKSDLDRLLKKFKKGRVLDKDPQTIRDWNAGKIPVLFAHPASAGHGLNLQDGGNILVFFGLNWDLELHEQIRERIGPTRQIQAGYDRPVFEYYIVASGTVDELILERLEGKREVQAILMDAMKKYLASS